MRMSKKIVLSPSLLSADFMRLGEQLGELKAAGADTLHVDVMDGCFVPNISLGQVVVKSLDKSTPLPMDVHLMIDRPERYLTEYNLPNVNNIGVHPEATAHLNRTLQIIKGFGKKTCAALNPSTPINTIEWELDNIDLILIMTVNPGFGGQAFIPSMLPKIEQMRKMVDERGLSALVGVDGGVSDKTVRQLVDAGADYLVAGNYLFHGRDSIGKAVDDLLAALG
jgi:ribulose-phosphate 3-epimerase